MKIEIRTPSLSKSSWANQLAREYEKKISHFQSTELRFCKSPDQLLLGIGSKDWVVLCDERGEAPSSRQFAKSLEQVLQSGKQKVHFLIGGPFGVTKEIRLASNQVISLSHFVLNQELALVVVCEQLFRALTIINNHPYHND
jgi:23S rRNA (pseudouridine1915-N3)-methyltransferase